MSEQAERLRAALDTYVLAIDETLGDAATNEECADYFTVGVVKAITTELGITEEVVKAVKEVLRRESMINGHDEWHVLADKGYDALSALMEVGNA